MKTGDRVSIYARESFAHGSIASVLDIEDLPNLPGMPAEPARKILAEGNMRRVAIVEYDFLGTLCGFAALEDHQGRWWDLQGNAIRFEPRHADTWQDIRDAGKQLNDRRRVN